MKPTAPGVVATDCRTCGPVPNTLGCSPEPLLTEPSAFRHPWMKCRLKSVSLMPHTILRIPLRSGWPAGVMTTVIVPPPVHFAPPPSRIDRNCTIVIAITGFDLFTITATSSAAAREAAPRPRAAVAARTANLLFIDVIPRSNPEPSRADRPRSSTFGAAWPLRRLLSYPL